MGVIFSYIFNSFYGREQITLAMLGLSGAGKTTILSRLKLGVTEKHIIPSSGILVEKIEHNDIDYTVWDIGYGHCWDARIAKMIWHNFFWSKQHKPFGLMLVIDGSDREHVDEAREFFKFFLDYKDIRKNPILILVNKQDLPDVMTPEEAKENLGLTSFHIQTSSAYDGSGLTECFDWFANQLSKKVKRSNAIFLV